MSYQKKLLLATVAAIITAIWFISVLLAFKPEPKLKVQWIGGIVICDEFKYCTIKSGSKQIEVGLRDDGVLIWRKAE